MQHAQLYEHVAHVMELYSRCRAAAPFSCTMTHAAADALFYTSHECRYTTTAMHLAHVSELFFLRQSATSELYGVCSLLHMERFSLRFPRTLAVDASTPVSLVAYHVHPWLADNSRTCTAATMLCCMCIRASGPASTGSTMHGVRVASRRVLAHDTCASC